MTLTLLLLGFLMGMRHATEADHLAAVATMVNGKQGVSDTAIQGAAWGLGHTITLFLFAGIALLMGEAIPENYASLLESLVGVMLVALGLDVLRKMYKNRIHFHAHKHGDSVSHFHAHSHEPGVEHNRDAHEHKHERTKPGRALLVGLMHGMAGSAALVILAVHNTQDMTTGLLYILLFGLGSVLGMAALSATIIVPLRFFNASGLTSTYNAIQLAVGLFTIGLGGMILWENQLALI